MLIEEKIKLSRHVLTTLIISKCLNTFTKLVFYFCLKFNKFVQGIELPMHQINISEPRIIICKCDEVLIPSPCMDNERSAHINSTNSKHSMALNPLVVKSHLVISLSI